MNSACRLVLGRSSVYGVSGKAGRLTDGSGLVNVMASILLLARVTRASPRAGQLPMPVGETAAILIGTIVVEIRPGR
jgi:hypothetical protein